MVLPELSLQFAYGRLAWGSVLAACVVAAWPATRRLPRALLAAVLAAACLLMLLPGQASPAWSLILAFQYPSGLLLGLCLVKLHARWQRAGGGAGLRGAPLAPVLPARAAAVLAVVGALVYLDAFGLLAGGYYYAGFGPALAPVLAVLVALGCALALVQGRARPQAWAVLGAVALFSLARLPTGNLWDALLDPLLWIWAVVSVVVTAVRALVRKVARAPAAPLVPAPGAEPFSPIKE